MIISAYIYSKVIIQKQERVNDKTVNIIKKYAMKYESYNKMP